MARERYPSDHRRWFRVAEDVLDDPRLNAVSLEDQALYFRLLATLNRQKSRDGWGHLDTFAACALARRERWAYALPAFDRLAAGGLVTLRYRDGGVSYLIAKWPEHQGFTPSELRRNSGATPAPKTTPTPTPNEEKTHASHEAPAGAAHPPPANDPARWVSILGAEPGSAEEKRAFVERELPLAVAEAEQHHPRDRKAQRGKIKSVLIRHYRWQRDHPVPMAARARDRPQTFHEISVENSKEAARDSLDFAERLVRQREEARSNGIRRIGATAGSAAPRLLDVPVPRARDGE